MNSNRQQKEDMGILHHKVSGSAEHKGWISVPQAEGIYGLSKIREMWPCGEGREDRAQMWVMLHEEKAQ